MLYQSWMGEDGCVGGTSSMYSKGVMLSILAKCWTELLWPSESLQLVRLCCVHFQTAQLEES